MAITRLWSIYLDNAAIVNRLKMAVISKLEHVCSSKKHIKSHIIAPDDEEHTLTAAQHIHTARTHRTAHTRTRTHTLLVDY